jgi:hypothetical protein
MAAASGKKSAKTSTNAAKAEKKVPAAQARKSPASVKTSQNIREEKSEKRMRQEKTETTKTAKPKKSKLLRDSYSIPENEHQEIAVLKKRCIENGRQVKKSYLLRAGIQVLGLMDDRELLAAVERVR